MKQYKKWFVFVVTFIVVLCVFLLCDALLGSILYLLCYSVWGALVAREVFKWVVIVLFVSQVVITFPFALKAVYIK